MNNVEQMPRAGTDRIVVRTYTALMVTGLLTGCTVGPDFKPPAAPDIAGYTATPLVMQTAATATALGDAQHFRSGAKVSAQWWHDLGSPKLDALIE